VIPLPTIQWGIVLLTRKTASASKALHLWDSFSQTRSGPCCGYLVSDTRARDRNKGLTRARGRERERTGFGRCRIIIVSCLTLSVNITGGVARAACHGVCESERERERARERTFLDVWSWD
jgi:hypothetical protein